jgi:cell division protein FtsN
MKKDPLKEYASFELELEKLRNLIRGVTPTKVYREQYERLNSRFESLRDQTPEEDLTVSREVYERLKFKLERLGGQIPEEDPESQIRAFRTSADNVYTGLTNGSREEDAKVLSSLDKLGDLYAKIPKERLSEKVQTLVLREARWQARKHWLISLVTLRAFFKQPSITAISSAIGIAIGVALSNSFNFDGLYLTRTTEEKQSVMRERALPTVDKNKSPAENQYSRLPDSSLGEKVQPLKKLKPAAVVDSIKTFVIIPGVEKVTPAKEGIEEGAVDYFALHLGSFRVRSLAEKLNARLLQAGFKTVVEVLWAHVAGDQQQIFRVAIGPFDTRAQLQEMNQKLEEEGFEALPVRALR